MIRTGDIGILVLAAGVSRRFGSDKRRATLPSGVSLLQQSIDNARASGLPVAVCLRPGEEDLVPADVTTLFCSDAHLGMGHTLAQGIAGVGAWQGALIALGDMPDIRPATFCTAAESLAPDVICQPVYRGQPGHPVGFDRSFFPALEQLTGDVGARQLLKQHRQAVVRVPVDDPGIFRDIDTPADLA